MSDLKRAAAFLEQAKSDENGSAAAGLPEATARYLLQQACEKAMKAFGYARYRSQRGDGGEVEAYFFNRHDPMTTLTAAEVNRLPNGVKLLRREMETFLAAFPEQAALKRIDATTPSLDPTIVSYRYPFQVDGEWTAPSKFVRWDDYQGPLVQVRSASKKLLAAVERQLSLIRRARR